MSPESDFCSKNGFDLLEDGLGLSISANTSELSDLSNYIRKMGYNVATSNKMIIVSDSGITNKTKLYVSSRYPIKYFILEYNSLKGDRKEAFGIMRKVVNTDFVKSRLMGYWRGIGISNTSEKFGELLGSLK